MPLTPQNRIRDYFRKSIRQLVWALLVFSLFGYLGTWHRLFELFCHFRLQYVGCAVLGGIALLVLRDFRTSLVALVALGINATAVLPWYFGKPVPPAKEAAALKVLLANVYSDNRDTSSVLELIARENPEVIVLLEINDRWAAALKPLAERYPNYHAIPQDDNFGIGVWTRLPGAIEIAQPGHTGVPSVLAELSVQGKAFSLLATHPVPPVRGEMFDLRNAQLDAIAEWSRTVSSPHLVVGDLNMTLWSPYHARLLRAGLLSNTRQGFGVLPSWPTMVPFMEIPLDHCLISAGIGVRSIRTGPKIGSDHLPLIVELAL